ncbi:c-type cytochrome [Romeria aff. gracilis LEGE 07310]|uniref:Cytochrome c6 n=1 Tax=Vasconcelosia minhoensis LEGE 07310 TaxID=915328 RepID=A0A8J7AIW5_9CYAN|nr:c-type cytochrome [Romeria gracilis]MBE9076230.1 c-type cytochrome [Romeria aff. gracilis LEGE 07310]
MKLILSVLALIGALFLLPAAALADGADGAQVFSSNCASCHMGGGNVVNRSKTLKQETLEQYDMASLEAITYQVIHGKNAMPSFLGRLSQDQIEAVAAYVLDQAGSGW